ncbi:hypothetical protein TorRG33x02_183660 [Trema orientale]|uniref:Uncharacterized protein n=1 Tax=Trema orientale TaxID=63057 RepID=A0A2P5EK72_TREOI|nr:hypothetical protein TorRG33x02_183660 [Trema orientale]
MQLDKKSRKDQKREDTLARNRRKNWGRLTRYGGKDVIGHKLGLITILHPLEANCQRM